MKENLRVLGRTRISRSSEESTSLERQRELIEQWCRDNGHTLIGVAEDVDVSGTVDPFQTPALGPWLTERAHEWDILLVWRMDRLTRKARNLHKMFGYIEDHHKRLVSINDAFDLSTLTGQMTASMLGYVAQGELEAIRERTRASHTKLRSVGRWTGGRPPYGYAAVHRYDDNGNRDGWTLEPHPEAAPVIHRIIDEFLGGTPASRIAATLDAEGVPSPAKSHKPERDTKWSSHTIRRILKSPTLLGHQMSKGELVRGDDGAPVPITKVPILDREKYDRVQAALDDTAGVPNRKHKASKLLRVAWCMDHPSEPLHAANGNTQRGHRIRYYRCPTGECGLINADWLEASTEDQFLQTLGDYRQVQKRVTRPVDHSAEIADIEERIRGLTARVAKLSTSTAEAVWEQIENLDSTLETLKSEHSEHEKVEWIPTGATFRELYENGDDEERRRLMLTTGIRVEAAKINRFHIMVPHDLKQRLGIE